MPDKTASSCVAIRRFALLRLVSAHYLTGQLETSSDFDSDFDIAFSFLISQSTLRERH